MGGPSQTLEQIVRGAYSKLLAYLTSRSGDMSLTEDLLNDAFEKALVQWEKSGVPEKPVAWILTTARNALMDKFRHQNVHKKSIRDLQFLLESAAEQAQSKQNFPDERLEMMFVASHPEIEAKERTPLILQTVMGFCARDIANLYLVKPSMMSQRLVRAKDRIVEKRIPFQIPESHELARRMENVRESVYGLYTLALDQFSDRQVCDMLDEALYLVELLVQQFPKDPEVLGLASLIFHSEARRQARLSLQGEFIPLFEQDTNLWDDKKIAQADHFLARASIFKNPGKYQYEAVIQSIHSRRRLSGEIDWKSILLVYEEINRLFPSISSLLGLAAAYGFVNRTVDAWRLMNQLPESQVINHQPYWALQAFLYEKEGKVEKAKICCDKAIALSQNESIRRHLKNKKSLL